jgi:hypothetical protein
VLPRQTDKEAVFGCAHVTVHSAFSGRRNIEMRKLRHLIPTLLSLLSEIQIAQYLAIVSEDLRTATDELPIRTALQALTPELWPRIAEIPRLRIENKLIRSIKEGEILRNGRVTGTLGTWSVSFIKYFSMRSDVADALINKLEDADGDDRHYVAKYFIARLPETLVGEQGEVRRAVTALATAIRNGDSNVREAVVAHVRAFPSQWQSQIVEALKDVTDPMNPAVVLADGTPLLGAPTATEEADEDIPF